MSILLSALMLAAAEPVVCPDGKDEGCNIEQVNGQMDATPRGIAAISQRCLYRTSAKCVVLASGTIGSGGDGPKVAWQKVNLTGGFMRAEMVMLFDIDQEAVQFIGQVQTNGRLWSPELLETGNDETLLHVRGQSAGSGAGNEDLLFAYREGNWQAIDITSWWDSLDEKLPKGFGIWKGVEYDFSEMFAYSPVWREDDANCCATGGKAFLDFAIENDALIVNELKFEETRPVPEESSAENNAAAGTQVAPLKLASLSCKVENAVYEMPGNTEWAINFMKPKIAPAATSDLLMMVTGSAFVSQFAFESSQGFGGTYLQTTLDDDEAGQAMPATEQPEDAISFHAFGFDEKGGLVRLADAPIAGSDAPAAIYIPDVSKYFWYDEKYEDPETGETLSDPVNMPQGLFIGSCLK